MKTKAVLAFFVLTVVVAPVMADPPALSGVVMRGETSIGFFYTDLKRGYIVVYGWDLFGACQGDPEFEISLWNYQVADPPPDQIIHEQLKGDVATSVWPLEAGPNPCAFWPIASGHSSVLSNLSGDNVANMSAHGVLTDPVDGESMVFTSNLHCVTDGFGTCVDNYHAKIVLN